MRILIGLGNIGQQYAGTRHNIGFAVLESLAATHKLVWQHKDRFKATIAEADIEGQKVVLAKPSTLYNASGDAVRAIKDFYKADNADILVVHDELALPFGAIRTRNSGSDAGNNGIKSIVAAIGPDVARIRIGTANEHVARQDAADFVLSHFTAKERAKLPQIEQEARQLLQTFIVRGRLPHSSVSL